jgi:hypothetical protein|tara:strand:- start:8777 stop:9577 length:801 start_codon:yes stop_codon:yes gene_type:complete
MTITEFSNEFDITYNSIATNSAPAIDLYEKSVYLTRAQLELVNNYFNPKGNKYGKGFEQDSKRRADLRELIRPYLSATISTEFTEEQGIAEADSYFFRVPNDVYFIIQEKVEILEDDYCGDNNTKIYVNVKPITHDEYNLQKNNPFKQPDRSVVWRLDIYSIDSDDDFPGGSEPFGAKKLVELVSPVRLLKYKFRYIIYPSPIILTDLLADYPYEDLSIDGITSKQTCKLGENIHRTILNRAVEMAVADYKPKGLAPKIELNKRNE